jgi:hypothetical protein
MLIILKMPTYNELVGLADAELTKRIDLALGQVNQAEERGENMIDKAKIYLAYKNEQAKRNYEQRARWPNVTARIQKH